MDYLLTRAPAPISRRRRRRRIIFFLALRQQSRDECVCAGERDKGEKFPRNSRRSIFLWPSRLTHQLRGRITQKSQR